MAVRSFSLKVFYLLTGLTGLVMGTLFSPLIPLFGGVPPGIIMLALFFTLPFFSRECYTATLAQRTGLLLGLCFGIAQTLLMWLVNINSKVFTGFFVFDRSFVIVSYALLGGMLALLVHALRERKWGFALLFLAIAFVLEMITLHYWFLRHWILLPARPYILPFSVTVGAILFSLLYRIYYLKMLGIHHPIRRRNRT